MKSLWDLTVAAQPRGWQITIALVALVVIGIVGWLVDDLYVALRARWRRRTVARHAAALAQLHLDMRAAGEDRRRSLNLATRAPHDRIVS